MTSKNVTSKPKVNPQSNYSLVDQLQRASTQISIFELLELSLRHKKVLKDALCTINVPKNLDVDQFQNMANPIAIPHYLTFSEKADKSLSHPNNLSLHIKVMIYKTHVIHVLIDGSVGLNIFSLSHLKMLGYSEKIIDTRRKIIIKAYDEVERLSKGLAIPPIRISPIEKDILFQIVDDGPLVYYTLLSRLCFHDM